ncbi:disease resistance protein [Salix suchowensis]|nr:disease resistance protein [Salix suchowensis]
MHDVLLKLGREIVVQENIDPRERSRLWDADDVYRVLTTKGTGKVESISLNLYETTEIELSPAAFEGMYNLRLLKFYYPYDLVLRGEERVRIHLPQGLHSLSNELRILDWCYYPLKSLPSNFFPEKLVVLEMPRSQLEQLWNEHQPLENLKIMNLRSSSKLILSDFDFSYFPNLELNLRLCYQLASLPESIGELKSLVKLDLFSCSKLASLPNSIRGLESLESFDLGNCSKLNRFPILNPRRLEVEEIASTTNKLGCRRILCLEYCGVLEIPGSIGSWVSLTTLRLYRSDCERIPASIKQLPSSLQVLDASDCISLTSVELFVPRSSFIKRTDDNFVHASHIRTLFGAAIFDEPVSVRLCIPGSEVPEWFTYKNTEGPTVKIKLPDHCHRANTTDQLFGFTLCVVVSFGSREEEYLDDFDIKCECHLITKDGTHSDLSFHYGEGWGKWEREHVFIWSIQSHCSFKEASFHFKPLEETDHDAVVQSGVHPLFVEDYIDEPEQPKRLKLMGN